MIDILQKIEDEIKTNESLQMIIEELKNELST